MRVAITGANGRLGRALVAALADAPFTGLSGPIGWGRSDYDLDDPDAAERLVARDRPEVVVHTAAWTDVDGCAREPDLAMRRNGAMTGDLAAVCAAAGIDLVVISTNEVFDGERTDRQGYRTDDPTAPPNPYGASKLAGELAAREAYLDAAGDASLAIVRTAWLYGPPGNDFPTRLQAAAERAASAGERLRVVADEIGSPTLASDLAEAITELIGAGAIEGIWHLVNPGAVSRAEWAREIVRAVGPRVEIEEIPASAWTRESSPPRWAVLEPSRLPSGERMRSWQEAFADHVPWLVRARTTGARTGG